MSGKLGVVCVVVAMMLTGFLGFLGSVDEVESNVTNWDYVTDVAGAFDSDKSDMFSRYNPSANLTGYSVFKDYNNSYLTGGEYSTATGANEYFIYSSSGASTVYTVTLTPNKTSGIGSGSWSATLTNSDGTHTVTGTMDEKWGMNNNDIVSWWNGSQAYGGVVGVKMKDIMDKIVQATDMEGQIRVQLEGTSGSSIGFGVSNSTGQRVIGDYSGIRLIEYWNPTSESSSATYDPSSGISESSGMNGTDDVYIVWQGNPTRNSTSNVPLVFTIAVNSKPNTTYLDPTNGVTPAQQTLNTTTYETHTYGADNLTLNVTSGTGVSNPGGTWNGQIAINTTESSGTVGTLAVVGYESARWMFQFTFQDGTEVTQFEHNVNTFSLTFSKSGSTWSLTAGGTTKELSISGDIVLWGIQGANLTTISSITGTFGRADPAYSADVSATITNNRCYGSTQFDVLVPVTISTTYTNTYWNNNYKMSEMSIILKRPTTDIEQRLNLHGIADANGYEHMSTIIISYTQAGGWNVITGGRISPYSPYFGDANVNLGQWPAIIINVNLTTSTLSVQPITTFTNFTDYSYIESLQTKICDIDSNGSYIDYMVIPDTNLAKMSMSVTNTVIFIEGGGLYMQNATISTNEKFGSSVADRTVKISFDSFVRIGDGITVNNVRFNVNSDKSTILIDDKAHPLARTTAVYVPESVGAFYYRGSTYAAGHAYLIDSDNGVTDCGTATDLDVTLNGTWLTTANMSLGTNEHTSTPTWGGSNWSLDVNGTIVIFIGFLIVCAIVGKIKLGMDALDIAIILGSAIIALMVIA